MSDNLLRTTSDRVPFSRPQSPHARLQLGFVGLGSMGFLMARNLANHGAEAGAPPLIVWNRSVAKSKDLEKQLGANKIRIAKDPAEVAAECDVIITNLANDEVVRQIYQQFREALRDTPPVRNKIFVETSTIYPTLAGELDALIVEAPHAHLITCPVFGAPPAADKAQLLLIMSGDYRSKKEVAFLLIPAIGRKAFDLGGNLEKAPTFKLIGNSMILGSLEILAEAFTLAEKSGIAGQDVQNLVQELLPAPPLVAYGEKMLHDKFDGSTGFSIDGGIKDASHIRRLTAEHNSPMPNIDTAHQHLLTARAIHSAQKVQGKERYETLDWSAIVAGCRVGAGLDGFDSAKHANVVHED